MLTAEDISRAAPGPLGAQLTIVESTTSTNDDLMALARAGAPAGQVLIAEQQTAGRGRLGRSWHSPQGMNLYLSLLLRPAGVELAALPPLALVTGVAVVEALRETVDVVAELKWPNDVMIGARKVCGVLTEAVAGPPVALVIGIGVNVNQLSFPDELTAIATSLHRELGAPVDRARLVAAILRQLHRRLQQALAGPAELGAVLAEWRRCSATIGRQVRAPDGTRGVAEDVAPSGALLVRAADGELHQVLAGPLEIEASR